MANIKLENLDNSPINFELSEEDLKSIKGGNQPTSGLSKINIWIVKIECYCEYDDFLVPSYSH